MNIIGHIAVAARHGPDDPVVFLGAALPDLAAWGRFRLDGSRSKATAVACGVALHHRTDSAFHSHPWFVDIQTKIRRQLEAGGVARGPARASAHVGVEMLLDGALDHDPTIQAATIDALGAIASNPPGMEDLVGTESLDRWRGHLDAVSRYGVPTDYGDPHAVAARLVRILSHRPRLRLDASHCPTVASVLADHGRAITATARPLVDELAGMVAMT